MPISVRCDGCGQNFRAPDEKTGLFVPCPACQSQVLVEPPLMPPGFPGGRTQPHPQTPSTGSASVPSQANPVPHASPITPGSSGPPISKSNSGSGPPPRSAVPPARSGIGAASAHGAGPAAPPRGSSTSPPSGHAPPTRNAPPHSGAQSDFQVESHEALEKAVQMSRSNPIGWIIFLIVVLIGGLLFGGYALIKLTRVNPPIVAVEKSLPPSDQAIKMLGPRQTGAGYSFLLPEDFVPVATKPSTSNLPRGTISYAWEADAESDYVGSQLRVWVIPQEMNLREALVDLDTLGNRLDYHAFVSDKSGYRRLSNDMLSVRGLVEGSTSRETRKGSIYLIADRKRTVMVIGVATGIEWQEARFMLDHAPRTIRREY